MITEEDRLRGIIRALMTNKHAALNDHFYAIKEREGSWDGPSMTAWNKTIADANAVVTTPPSNTPSAQAADGAFYE